MSSYEKGSSPFLGREWITKELKALSTDRESLEKGLKVSAESRKLRALRIEME